MKKPTILALTMALSIVSQVARAQQTFQCDSIITNGLREYNITSDSSSYLNSVFSTYCHSSGQRKEGASNLGLDTVVKSLPIKFTAGQSNSSLAMSSFCKSYSEFTDATRTRNVYQETIVARAYETYAQCVALAVSNYFLTHDIISPAKAQLYFRTAPGEQIQINGIDTSSNIVCEGPHPTKNELVTYGKATRVIGDKTIGIFCTRNARLALGQVQTYDEGTVAIDIRGYKYNFFWPKSEHLPEDVAAKIQTSISDLKSAVDTLSSADSSAVSADGKVTCVRHFEFQTCWGEANVGNEQFATGSYIHSFGTKFPFGFSGLPVINHSVLSNYGQSAPFFTVYVHQMTSEGWTGTIIRRSGTSINPPLVKVIFTATGRWK